MEPASRFPPIPNGWFAVAFSDELRRGDVRPLRAFGRDLVLFRTASGQPAVLDAYCAHLGAHLAKGGRVVNESIECPFHRWRYDAGGQCREIPYARRIPPRACVRGWSCAEANGFVLVYHHAEEAPPASPPAVFEHVESPGWTPMRRWEYELRSHPQELAENVADLAHFVAVHYTATSDPELRVEGGCFSTAVNARLMVRERPLPITTRISMTCHGLGQITVNLRMPLANVTILSYSTPVEGERIHVRQRYFAEVGRGPAAAARWLVSQAVCTEAVAQVRQDQPIWANKVYRAVPRLCEEDRLLGAFRKWAKQFYVAGPVTSAASVAEE